MRLAAKLLGPQRLHVDVRSPDKFTADAPRRIVADFNAKLPLDLPAAMVKVDPLPKDFRIEVRNDELHVLGDFSGEAQWNITLDAAMTHAKSRVAANAYSAADQCAQVFGQLSAVNPPHSARGRIRRDRRMVQVMNQAPGGVGGLHEDDLLFDADVEPWDAAIPLIHAMGADCTDFGIVPDRLDATRDALRRAVDKDDSLENRFNLQAVALTASSAARIERDLPHGVGLFEQHPVVNPELVVFLDRLEPLGGQRDHLLLRKAGRLGHSLARCQRRANQAPWAQRGPGCRARSRRRA